MHFCLFCQLDSWIPLSLSILAADHQRLALSPSPPAPRHTHSSSLLAAARPRSSESSSSSRASDMGLLNPRSLG